MITIAERLTKKCIHWTGLMDKVCRAGVTYSEVIVGKPLTLPCLSTGGQCCKAEYPTLEEAEKREKELADIAASHIAMYMLAKDHFSKTREREAVITCVCGGKMKYAVAQNGHIRARCPSCGQSFLQ